MQTEILQMAAADLDTYWKRLTEQWGAWADAALYKELEMERKRWLLSALYSISPMPDTGIVRTAGAERRILAFFETQGKPFIVALYTFCPQVLINDYSNGFIHCRPQRRRPCPPHVAESSLQQAAPQRRAHDVPCALVHIALIHALHLL